MSKILILVLSFSLYNCLCQAQILSDQWVISEPNGCKLVDPYFQNGMSFTWDGPCKDNMAHGFGKLIKYNNGEYESTYEGNYNMGVREGMGTFSHKDGTSKSGTFINGQLMGYGTMKDLNGSSYVGNFINYRMHGNGIYVWPEKNQFEGYFVSDNPYTGKLYFPDGTVSYIQQFYKVDTIIENKSNYNPEIGREIIEYFDSNWERCAKDSASYFRRITYLKDNEPKGIIRDYYISGTLQSEYHCIYLNYDDEGKNFFEGKALWYYKNGNVERSNFYFNNKINGTFTSYYENGKIYNETQYKHGIQNVEYKQYYPTGEIELKGIISNDARIGHWIKYDVEGNIADTIDLSQKWDDLNQEFEEYLKDENFEKAMKIADISNKFALLKYGGDHENYFTSLNNIGFIYLKLEQYQNALNFFVDALEYTVKTVGKTHYIYATFLNSIGWLHSQKGEYEKTLPYYIEALENTEFNFGKTHPKYGTRLSNVALLYKDMKQYEKAISYAIEALEVTEKNFGILNPEYGSRARDVGSIYLKLEQKENALPYYLKALEYHENISDIDSEKYGTLLDILNIIYKKLGQSENLFNILTKKLEFTAKNIGKSTTDYLNILIDIGALYSDLGQFEKALPFLLEALKKTEENLGYDHPSLGSVLHNLGFCYSDLGQYEDAISYLMKSLEYNERSVGKTHPNYIRSLLNIGELYYSSGQYPEALNYNLETQKHIEKSFGKAHYLYGVSLNTLATIYAKMGRHQRAIGLFLECLENTEKSLGKTHPSYNVYLNNIGLLLSEIGRDEIALFFLQESLKLAEESYGKLHPKYANKLNSIGFIYSELGEYEKALPYFLEALEIIKLNVGIKHSDYGRVLNNIGSIYSDLGQYEKALPLYSEALNITEKTYGKAHPEYGNTLNNIGMLYYKFLKFETADSFLHNGCKILLDHFKLHSKFLSEKDNENYYKMIEYKFTLYKGLVLAGNKLSINATSNIYNFEIELKSLILKSLIKMRQVILFNADTSIIKKYDEWMKLKIIIAKENSLPIENRREDLVNIQENSNNVETELARLSAPFRNEFVPIKWTNIQQSLNANTVSIEFVEIPSIEESNSIGDVMIAALIVKKSDTHPQLVPLFKRNQLDSLFVRNITKESSFINRIYFDKKMFELIWKPLEPLIKKGNQIYYAPSGLLNQINLGSIITPDSTYLSDEYTFHQVTTTAILASGQDKEMAVQDIAIFGGIDFDASDEKIVSAAKNVVLGDNIVSRSLYTQDSTRSGKWTYLNGTFDEAQSIDKMAKTKNIKSELFTGEQAIEERFKSLSGKESPSVIHIATHGFFFTDPKIDKKKFELMSFQSENTFTLADNPMNRSGLLFAGGNKAWIGEEQTTEREDGVLTAYEVSNMSLFNTELVVLSACETGLGDIKGSEGVYGLQRAFKMAGVRYLMMSLWKVPDNATQEFMTTFYTELLTHKKSIRDAYNTTQKQMRDKYRDEPYKWAGFVLME